MFHLCYSVYQAPVFLVLSALSLPLRDLLLFRTEKADKNVAIKPVSGPKLITFRANWDVLMQYLEMCTLSNLLTLLCP